MPSPRYVTDSSLARLARRLRFLGYDVQVIAGARLEELFEAGRREDRIVLTSSARHPRRYADVAARRLPRGDEASALREIAAAHVPAGAPFSRCPSCNVVLRRRHPLEAAGEVPSRVLRRARELTFCPSCGKWYWQGSHVERLTRWLESVLGRPLPATEPEDG